MEPPRSKRQKVNQACQSCRSRKIKCDGIQPVCAPCRNKGSNSPDCVWQISSDRRSAQTSTLSSQWQELRPYPQKNTDLSPEAHIVTTADQSRRFVFGPQRKDSTTALDVPSSDPIAAHVYDIPSAPTQASLSSTAGLVGDIDALKDANTDGEVSPFQHSVHAIIGTTQDSDIGEGFFGKSSAGNFMQSVKKMVERRIDGGSNPSSAKQHWSPQGLPISGNSRTQSVAVDYVLPSRRRADTLMSCYWRYVHVLYPYLDKRATMEDYEKLWNTTTSSSIADERSFMCLLNVIFALSSQLDESTLVQHRQQLAHAFYMRAKELLDIVETAQIRSVQCFLLLGQYYQSTSEPHPCWIFTGLAIRTAQGLGLHLAETSEQITDVKTRELLRKLWYGCVLMDRVVSMTYGRPCMVGPVAASVVPLPLPLDEDYLVPDNARVQNAQSQQTFDTEFFVLSIKLYEIMHDIIYYFYSVNFQPRYFGEKFFVTLDNGKWSLFEIERRLSMWINSIPKRFKLHPSDQVLSSVSDKILHRQGVVLHQRQLHVRLLLLRSVLSNFISTEISDGEVIAIDKVAIEAIDIVHREGGGKDGKIGYCAAPWYNVLYLYTSATVLIAARLAPTILAEISEEKILSSWNKAIEILDSCKSTNRSIERLTTTLGLLFDAVPEQYSRLKSNAKSSVLRQNDPSSAAGDQGCHQGQASVHPAHRRPRDYVSYELNNQAEDMECVPNETKAVNDDFLFDFNVAFDPNDLDWLMTIPLDS